MLYQEINMKNLSYNNIDDFLLKEIPQYIADVEIPKNTDLRMGLTKENFDQPGGGIQYEILNKEEVTKDWFSELGQLF